MSMENLVQSQHIFFPWNGICLCHVQLTSFSARSFSVTSFTVTLDAQIILAYLGGVWEASSLRSSQSHRTQRTFPPSCKQHRKESQLLRLSYNLYHRASLSCAYGLAKLCRRGFLCWASSSGGGTWVSSSWSTQHTRRGTEQGALSLSSPPCCQQSPGAESGRWQKPILVAFTASPGSTQRCGGRWQM